MAICQQLGKAFCKTWHSLPFLKACLIKAAPLVFILGKQKLNRMRSHCSPSLLHHRLGKVLSNQINSVHRCLSDKHRSVPTGNIPLPGLSLCSPLPATVGSRTQCLQCGRQQSPSFLPHSPFIVLLVSLVLGERRVRGSWPSFLKCQAPGGWRGGGGVQIAPPGRGSLTAAGATGKF